MENNTYRPPLLLEVEMRTELLAIFHLDEAVSLLDSMDGTEIGYNQECHPLLPWNTFLRKD